MNNGILGINEYYSLVIIVYAPEEFFMHQLQSEGIIIQPGLTLSKKIIFALGQLGWALASYAPGNLLVYFYLPPNTGAEVFPARIYQGYVLGFLTLIGLAFGAGRLFDAITDPLIAGLSDRSRSRLGKRRKFLVISALPFALLSLLVFTPPVSGFSPVNSIWVFSTIIIFYWFMTMYVTPYFAMMSELGHTPEERLLLSTLISITWAIGTAVGTQVFAVKAAFEQTGMTQTAAFQITIALFAGIGFLFMLLPIIFIDEKKYCRSEPNTLKITESLRQAFSNRNFRLFTISDLAYWTALTFATSGLVYYVTILLREAEAFTSTLQIIMFGVSFIFYLPTTFVARRTGKKRLMNIAFVVLAAVYAFIMILGRIPLGAQLQGYLIVIFMGLPLAVFGILPNSIVGDIAEADRITTGQQKTAIFFGARTFMSKMGQMIAGLIFPSLLLLGSSVGDDRGIRLTGLAAILFLAVGFACFLLYNEREVLGIISRDLIRQKKSKK
jgi:glycoside/pentoside/hexuronide:cation symporter, GPH family